MRAPFNLIIIGILLLAASSVLAADIHWNNASGGNWSDGGNWAGGVAPGSADVAIIDLVGTYTVTLDADAVVAGLQLGAASGEQALSLTGRTLTLQGASAVLENGAMTLSGSTLAGPGTLQIDGAVTLQANNTLALAVDLAGTLAVHHQGNNVSGAFTTVSESLLDIEIVNNWNPQITFASGWTNLGEITLDQSIGYVRAGYLGVTAGTLINDGTITVSGTAGTRTFAGDIVNNGTMNLDYDAILNSGAGGSTNNGAIGIAADQVFTISGGFAHAAGTLTGPGLVSFNGADAMIGTGVVPAAELQFTNSTLDAPGTLTNSGTLTFFSGNSVNTSLQNAGTLNIHHQSNTIGGSFSTTGSSQINLEIINNWNPQVSFTNGWTNNGTVNLGQSIGYARATVLAVGSGPLVNAGTIVASGTAGTRTINGDLWNQGTLAVDFNLIQNAGSNSRNEGAIAIAAGQVLTISGGFDQVSGTIDGPGQVSFSGADVVISANVVPTAELQFTNSTLASAGTLTNGGILTFYSGNTVNTGLVNQGTINVYHQSNTVGGFFVNEAPGLLNLEIVNNWNPQITFALGWNNSGTVRLDQSIGYARATYLGVQSGSLTNLPGALIAVTGTAGTRTFDADLVNNGTVDIDYNATLNSGASGSVNAAVIEIAENQILTVSGGFEQAPGSLADIAGPGHVNFNGADVAINTNVVPPVELEFTNSTLDAAGTLVNGGQLTFHSGNTVVTALRNENTINVYHQGNSFNGQLTTVPGSLLNLEIVNNWNPQITFANGWTNHGTISLAQSIGYARATYLGVTSGSLVNAGDGTISISGTAGTRTLAMDLTNHGVLNVDYALTLNSGDSGSLNDGSIALAENQVMTVTGGFEQAGGSITGPGHVSFNSAEVLISTNTVPAAELQFTNSTLDAPGTLANGGTLTFFSGNTIQTALENSSTIHVYNQGNTMAGQMTTTPGALLNLEIVNNWNPQISFEGGWVNHGTIDLAQSIAYGRATYLGVASGSLVNAGDGVITVGGTNGTRTIAGDLTNHGVLTADYSLTLDSGDGGSLNSSAIAVAEDQVFTVTGGFEQAGGDITGPGHVAFSSADVNISTGVAPSAELRFTNSSLTAPPAGLSNGNMLTFLSGNTISCGIANSGTIGIQNANNSFDGDFVTTGTSLLVMDIVNNWNPQATWAGGWTNNGTIRLGQTIAYGRTTALAITSGALINAVGGTIEVEGTNGSRGILADFENHGTVRMDHAFNLEGSVARNAPGGLFEGNGGLTVPAGFVNEGRVSPGILETTGQLEVFTDYSQDEEGVFSVRLGGTAPGTEHDIMYVLGTATLDGTLEIELADGFVPAYGDSFVIIDHDQRVGEFDAISGLEIPGGLFFNIAYRDDYVVLAAGDFLPPATRVISAGAGLGGSINPEGDVFVLDGGEVTFTITPDAGYGVHDVLVDGLSVGPAAVYHFADVTADHTIEAFFTPAGFDYEVLDIGSDTDMNAISWSDENNGVVVGAGGEIRITGDGGLTWWAAEHGVTSDLNDVVMIGGIIYAIGDDGVVCYSDDGGVTWALSPTGTTSNLNAVEFVHSGYGCAVGDDGTILCWDGAGGWVTQTIPGLPAGAHLYDITIVDGVVYVVGANGLIIRRDGPGSDWVIYWSGQSFDFLGISIRYGGGYAVGTDGQVWYTADGGLNWAFVDTGHGVTFHDCLHIGGAIYLVGDGVFIRSTDEGLSWQEVQLPGGGGYRGMTTLECRGYVTGLLGETYEYETDGCVEDPGTIQGHVTLDSVGQENYIIRLEDADDVLVESASTDAAGFYRFEDLATGFYKVIIELPYGIATEQERYLILVRAGSTAVVDYLLYIPSGVEEQGQDLPRQLAAGNYPNPFNPMTSIAFEMPRAGAVSLEIYDSAGRLVRRLLQGEAYPAGYHAVTWRGTDGSGRQAASGIYHYLLKVDGETRIGKMTLLK